MIDRILLDLLLGVLVANGLRVTIGIPPVAYWFRSKRCPICDGVGFIRAHTHTGDLIEGRVEDFIESRAEAPESVSPVKEAPCG